MIDDVRVNPGVSRLLGPATCSGLYPPCASSPDGPCHLRVFCLDDLCPFGLGLDHRGGLVRLSGFYAIDDGYRPPVTKETGSGSGVDEIGGDDGVDASGLRHCCVVCACRDHGLYHGLYHGLNYHSQLQLQDLR